MVPDFVHALAGESVQENQADTVAALEEDTTNVAGDLTAVTQRRSTELRGGGSTPRMPLGYDSAQ